MAKSLLRLQARELRKQGVSVREIEKQLGVSRGSVSLWVRDMVLTIEQAEALKQKELKGAELGRQRGSLVLKNRRLTAIESARKLGIQTLERLTEKELLISGLALYWGEGSKRLGRPEICNSDPTLIKFLLLWFKECFNIAPNQITCYIGINEMHRSREHIVKKYWSELTGIPEENFRKTSFKQAKPHKIYENFDQHFGTLALRPQKSTYLHYKIMGLIEGLKKYAEPKAMV